MIFRLALVFLAIIALAGEGITGTWTPNNFGYKPETGARGTAQKNLFDSGLNRIDARLGKEIWVGDPNYGMSLQDAISAIGSTIACLRVPAGAHTISGDLTVPANITLKPERGAVFTRTGGTHLTINGPLESGLWQCFNDNSTNHDWVVFGPGAVKEVCLEWWGAIANTLANADANYSALLSAIQTGISVEISNKYYIHNTTTADIFSNILVRGLPGKGELAFTNLTSTYTFRLMGQNLVSVKNVTFSLEGASAEAFVFTATPQARVEAIEFLDNQFLDNISLIRWFAPINIDPMVVSYGVATFRFNDNVVKNVHYSFIELIDVPCDLFEVKGNKITNFDYTFIHTGITNEHLYAENINTAKKMCDVENNIVTCDLDWWGCAASTGQYYCFVLFEGTEMYYHNNRVEGMHCITNNAVYDIYCSADNLVYTNNKWINNLCFPASKDTLSVVSANNELLKAKGAKNRYYKNNEFTVTADYITALGQPLTRGWVTFYVQTGLAQNVLIEDNLFNIYFLQCGTSTQPIVNFSLQRNRFNCNLITGSLVNIDSQTPEVDFSDATVQVKNNDITMVAGGVVGLTDVIHYFDLYNHAQFNAALTSLYRLIDISYNTVNITNAINKVVCYGLSPVTAQNVSVRNNYFNISSSVYSKLIVLGGSFKASNVDITGNVAVSGASNMPFPWLRMDSPLNFESTQYLTHGLEQVRILNNNAATSRLCKVQIERNFNGTKRVGIWFTLQFGYDVGQNRNTLIFTSSDGATQTIYLNKMDGIDTEPAVTQNFQLKQNVMEGYKVTDVLTDCRIVNSVASGCYFQFTDAGYDGHTGMEKIKVNLY